MTDVVKANAADLATVLIWLEWEYAEGDGEGFWWRRQNNGYEAPFDARTATLRRS